jgi:hypothetical protein
MLLETRTRDTQTLEALRVQVHSIEGIGGTRSYIALSTIWSGVPDRGLRQV